jgi:cell wall-associated NlpC family hydrolase
MNGNRRRLAATVLATLVITLLFATHAAATPLSQAKSNVRALKQRLDKINTQVDMAVENYDSANSRLAAVNRQISDNTFQLRLAIFNLKQADAMLRDRVVSMYMQHNVSFIDVLLSTQSFDDFVTQLDLLKKLGSHDAAIVKAIKALRVQIANRRVTLQADRKAALKLLVKRAAQRSRILHLQAGIQRLYSANKALIKKIEAAQAAAAKLAAQRARTGTPPGVVPGGGGPGHPEVVSIAMQQLGKPYQYGAAGPGAFDCSGLAMYCYAQIGISLSHGATDQYNEGTPISLSELQPGDLVFFGSATGYKYHVGIYVGGGSMIHAPHTGTVVQYGSISGACAAARY